MDASSPATRACDEASNPPDRGDDCCVVISEIPLRPGEARFTGSTEFAARFERSSGRTSR